MLRRTPLSRGTSQLKRTPLACGCSELRRTPMAQVSAQRRRDNSRRTIVVNAMRLIAEGRCARCHRADKDVFGHELRGRAHGADIVAPDCLLCNECNGWCEDNPPIAAWLGWKVSSKWPHNPVLEVGQAIDINGDIVAFSSFEPDGAA